MSFNLKDHCRRLNRTLVSMSDLTSDYNHRTGKGDAREQFLTDILRNKVPSNILISKGEIVDADFNRTPEFDCILHYSSDTPKLASLGDRKVIPCEDVLAIVEVKSVLSGGELDKFMGDINKLNQLNRYFRPTQHLINQASRDKADLSWMKRPIKCGERQFAIGMIPAIFFGYSGPHLETARKYVTETKVDIPTNFLALFVLNEYSILKDGREINSGEDTFAAFLFSVLNCVKDDAQRHLNCTVNFDKYYDHLTF